MSEPLFSQNRSEYYFLSKEEADVIINKATDVPFTGEYTDFYELGTYVCKQCGTALFPSASKFKSDCGWPSFDDAVPGAVLRVPDADGQRTEIVCKHCGAHLGHVFIGEKFTSKNTRNCVNSTSVQFIPAVLQPGQYATAIFAGGCFWGVEYYMQKEPGVISVISGYTGGHVKNPTYKQVCTGTTGHAEAVKIIFDPSKTSYEKLTRLFLEIHDPTQINGQGPDIGEQYRSEIFYLSQSQKLTAEKCLNLLVEKGYKIATNVTKASEFYDAEGYHQNYYFNNGKLPYCHAYTQRF